MWILTQPWWELVLRAAVVYVLLLVLIRVSGRRTVGQFTPFDLLVVMLLSESVSNALSGGDDSLGAGLLSAATLVGLNLLVAMVTARSGAVQTVLEGEPVLVGKDGKIFHQVLRKHHVPESDLRQALREADCELASMQCAFLEADGQVSILKKKADS
jgi:uncharacterized membrane protein YcaP (DUF421 family)